MSDKHNVSCNKSNDIVNLIKKEGRLSWDGHFITISLLAAKRSSCNRLNVGCVITINNRILATGYNGFLAGAPHISRVVDNHEQFTVHADKTQYVMLLQEVFLYQSNSICNSLSMFNLLKVAYCIRCKND